MRQGKWEMGGKERKPCKKEKDWKGREEADKPESYIGKK